MFFFSKASAGLAGGIERNVECQTVYAPVAKCAHDTALFREKVPGAREGANLQATFFECQSIAAPVASNRSARSLSGEISDETVARDAMLFV